MSFFDELKRRKVFRVAASYAVVAFIIMQLVEILFPMFNFPQWTQQFIVIVVLLGFPIAVILSWVFDKTPQGYIKTDAPSMDVDGITVNADRPFYTKKRNIFLVLGVLAGVLIGSLGSNTIGGNNGSASAKFTKMAILPFDNIKNDQENDFLGFALSDEIINRLGYLKSIVVRPSGSVRKYQGTEVDLNQVKNDLDVELIVTGSFIRDGDQLRLSTELIDMTKNERLWNKTIQVDYENIFQIQETVSRDIVDGLKYNLEADEAKNLKSENVDPLAYELYLRAKNMPTGNISNLETKIRLLQESIKMDSTYAESWAVLSRSCVLMSQAAKSGQNYINLAKVAIDRAMALNDESLTVLSNGAQFHSETGNVEKSTELSIKAMKLFGSGATLSELGYTLRYAGMLNESIEFYNLSSKLDESYNNRGGNELQLGKSSVYMGNYDESIEIMHRAIETLLLAENVKQKEDLSPVVLVYEGIPYLYTKNPEKAFPYFDYLVEYDPNNSWTIIAQTYKALFTGNMNKAEQMVASLISRDIHDSEMIYRFTHFYAMLNQEENALAALEKSIDRGFFCYPYMKSDPLTKSIHNHPRFKQILEKAKIRHELYEKRFGEEIRSLLGMTS